MFKDRLENSITSDAWPRISVFAANGVFLAAAVGLIFIRYASGSLYAVAAALCPGISREWALFFVNAVYYGVFLALPVLAASQGTGRAALRIRKLAPGKAILIALAAIAGVFLSNYITVLWSMLFQSAGFDVFHRENVIGAESIGALMVYLLSSTLLPAVFEELAFRGAVLSAYEKAGGRQAVLISAVLFTALHASVLGIPTELILGCVMAYLVISTGSIWSGVLYHAVHNGCLTVIGYIQETGGAAMGAADEALYRENLYRFYGGAAGISGLIFMTLLFAAAYSLIIRRIGRGRELSISRRFKMNGAEFVVLVSGLVTVVALYGEDLLKMMRILQ